MIILSGLLLLLLILFAYILGKDFYQMEKAKEEADFDAEEQSVSVKKDKVQAGENRDEASGRLTEEGLEKFKKDGLNPFGDDLQKEEMTDSDYQAYIHGMSHQKIKAEEKWGFYELLPGRVDWLLEALEDAKGMEHQKLYQNMLNKWKAGDFSTIDEDHNRIWKMQGGTVGKATGVLTKEEEEQYLNHQD